MKFSRVFLIVIISLLIISSIVLADGDTTPTQPQTPDAIEIFLTQTASNQYDSILNYYFPELASQSNEIGEEIPTAQALLEGSMEYNQAWDNEKRATIALAIVIFKEKIRGMQPAYFEKDGVRFYYDKERDADNPWSSDPKVKEKATIGAYIAMYRDEETNKIIFYWEEEWQEAPRSNKVDYGKFITIDNVIDFIDPSTTHETFARQLDVFDVSFVPMIILDNNRDELEKHPMYRQGTTYLDDRIDILLPNPNDLYGINGKMLSMEIQLIFFPETKIIYKYNNEVGELNQYFDEAFAKNQNTYIGLDGHQDRLDKAINTREFIENICTTDDIVDGTVWRNIEKSSLLSIYQWNSIDFTRTVVNNQFIEYP